MMEPRLQTFEELLHRAPARVRELLAHGDAVERVWAAWALNLRFGHDATPALVDAVLSDRDAGVRRHLVVLIAGAGRYDVLRTIATTDEDADVQAAATRFIVRAAVPGDAATDGFVRGVLANSAPAPVLVAALCEMSSRFAPDVTALATAHLASPVRDVRLAALDFASRYPCAPASAPPSLAALIEGEPDPDVRRRMIELWPRIAPARSMLEHCEALAPLERRELLQVLARSGVTVPSVRLAPIVDDDPELRPTVAQLVETDPSGDGYEFVLGLFSRDLDEGGWSRWLRPDEAPIRRLRELVAGTTGPLARAERAVLVRLVDAFHDFHSDWRGLVLSRRFLVPHPVDQPLLHADIQAVMHALERRDRAGPAGPSR